MSVVVLGLMAAIVVKAMPSGKSGESKQVINELLDEIEDQDETSSTQGATTPLSPSPTSDAGDGGDDDGDDDDGDDASGSVFGGVAGGPRGGIAGDTDQSACVVTVRVLTTAVEAYMAQTGTLPGTWAQLAAAGYLTEEPAVQGYSFTLAHVDGAPTGTVLVNGTEGQAGCSPAAAATDEPTAS